MKPYPLTLHGSALHYDSSGQMIQDLRRRARECGEARARMLASLRTVQEFEEYRAAMRANLLDAIGGLPAEKTPLDARNTGTVEEPGLTIEKLLFASQPDYFVTASCYLPHERQQPAPAVLFLCGHSDTGKAHPVYQQVCRDLAANGFIVLAIDPIGQGERFQYLRDGQNIHTSNTAEHSYAGLPFLLQGASVARHFVWDAMRAIDYLNSRPEVDATRIGATGNSGGGLQTALLTLLDDRLAAATPCTWITSQEAMMHTGHVQDMEQIVYGAMLRGPDHTDYLMGIAPRPVLLGAAAYDAFPIEGSIQSYESARAMYALYGQPENMRIVIDPAPHSFSPGLRQACVNWFRQHLKGEEPDFVTGDPAVLDEAALQVTDSGQVLQDFPHSRSIFDLTCELLETVQPPGGQTAQERRDALAGLLALEAAGNRAAPIHPRIAPAVHDGYAVERIWFFSAPQIVVAGVLFHPSSSAASSPTNTVLLLLERGTADLPEYMEELEAHLKRGHAVFVFDVRGSGAVATRSESSSEALHPGDPAFAATYPFFTTEFKMGCDAMMLGLSTLGLRVFDVLRAVDYLQSRADVGAIEVHGTGRGALLGYFAAALDETIAAVTCCDMLDSYRGFCRTRFYDAARFNLDSMAWGQLRHGDLEDYLPCIAPRPVQLIRPRNADGSLKDVQQ